MQGSKKRIKPLVSSPPIIFIGLSFTAIFLYGIYWLGAQITVPTNDQYILLFTAYTAGLGWVVNAHYSLRNQRKQHTIDVLLSHAKNSIYHEYAKTFNKKYPPLSEAKVKSEDLLDNHDLTESIRYLLNEYEFIAAAIKRNDLDYDLMKDTIRGQVCTLYRKCEVFIDKARGVEETTHTKPKPTKPKIFSHLIDLYEDWSEDE